MRLRAKDSFYSSETKQVNAGQVFDVDDARGREFIDRGLAEPAEKGAKPTTEEDAAPVEHATDDAARTVERAAPDPADDSGTPRRTRRS